MAHKKKSPAPKKAHLGKSTAVKKAAHPKAAPVLKPKPASAGADKGKPTGAVKRKLLVHKSAKPITFSLDEVRAIAKTNAKKTEPTKVKPATYSPSPRGAQNGSPTQWAEKPPIPNPRL